MMVIVLFFHLEKQRILVPLLVTVRVPLLGSVRHVKKVTYQSSIHAEVQAILNLPPKTNFRKVTLVVVREGMMLSRPCEKCQRVIESLGIRKVYYSEDGRMCKYNPEDSIVY